MNSVEELKKLASVEGGARFFIALNYNMVSAKQIEWNESSKKFCIQHEIDDTHEDLTEEEMAEATNIVKAIKEGAFYKY